MKLPTKALWSLAVLVIAGTNVCAEYNYGEVLQKSLFFYECQQSGPLPDWNRVAWRGPSCLKDGSDVGVDLTGGWFDAGDHVKFNFPMAYSVTMLAWGGSVYMDAYKKSGQFTILQNNLRFVCDYLIKCHTADNEFYGQVGNGGLDHAFWGPAESVESYMKRPAYKIDATNPGTDLAGEAAAALASASLIFKDSDPSYAEKLVSHSKKLYAFADKYRGKYPAAIPDAQGYYNSFSGYQDELVWGACWLYLATKDETYLQKAEKEYDSLATEMGQPEKKYTWTIAWDDKGYGCYVLLAQITGKERYHQDAQRWLDYWTVGVKDNKIKYTPGGLAWLDTWGSNRYAANTSFCALVYSDKLEDAALKKRYHDFAVSQARYILGDNPIKRSMVVGFGVNPPQRPHHRTCEGQYPGDAGDTIASVHTLYGALVGGPGNDDSYKDERNNYFNNEVACDYNAAFTGLMARMYQEFGGDPLATFPPPTKKLPEFWVEASVNSSGSRYSELRTVIKNMSKYPARAVSNLKFRYYVDISEVISKGLQASAVTASTNYTQGKVKIGPVTQVEGNIYYVEVDLTGENLYPGTQESFRREIQFKIGLSDNAPEGSWNPNNDWSFKNVGTGYDGITRIENIPVYIDDKQVFGAEYNKTPYDPTPVIGMPQTSALRSNTNRVSLSTSKGCSQLYVQGNNIQQVDLCTLNGKVIGRYSLSTLPARIDITSIPSGFYVARVRNTDGITTQQSLTLQR
jgi:endoglucanase